LCTCSLSSTRLLTLRAFALQVRMHYPDAPSFTYGEVGGAGVPGSKARVLERLRQLGWEDAIRVSNCHLLTGE
jgi:hypothetical protein